MTAHREPLPVKRDPTHVLTVTVPLRLDEGQTFYIDPTQDALRTVMAISRLATIGLLCGSPIASIEAVER